MKRVLTVLLALLIVFATGIFSLSVVGLPVKVTDEPALAPDENQVMANRFENMLNNNYVYGDEFSSVSDVLLGVEISLLEESKDGKIANSKLIDFAKNMYGIDASVFADEGKEPLSADGVTEILPRGYSVCTHKVEGVIENEDGTYTVYSAVTAENHDGFVTGYESISRFAKSEDSRFGYILIASELFEIDASAEALIL